MKTNRGTVLLNEYAVACMTRTVTNELAQAVNTMVSSFRDANKNFVATNVLARSVFEILVQGYEANDPDIQSAIALGLAKVAQALREDEVEEEDEEEEDAATVLYSAVAGKYYISIFKGSDMVGFGQCAFDKFHEARLKILDRYPEATFRQV